MNGLDLFSGIGGLSISLSPWVTPIAYCENDLYCQSVLLSRMWDHDIKAAPIWDDVRTLRGGSLETKPDIIYGGFPCQDISIARVGKGLEGERSGLFFEVVRLTKEIRPAFLFLENVPAIRTRGLSRVCYELASLRYDLRWTTVSAKEVGATHLRKRWFLLAHAHSECSGNQRKKVEHRNQEMGSRSETKPNDARHLGPTSGSSKRFSEPRVDRTGYGLSNRMDRLKSLGNAVVPMQARVAFERLMGLS